MGNKPPKLDLSKETILRLLKENSKYKIFGEWKMLKKEILGKGGFATVYKGLNTRTNKQVAIKKISCKEISDYNSIREIVENEIFLLKKCSFVDNPYLLKIFQHFQCPQDQENTTYLVLEYCNGGNLSNELKKHKDVGLGEKKSLEIAYQILIGMKALSDLEIIHRDLKPDNILIHQDEKTGEKVYKIGDFGLSKKARRFNEKSGTMRYMGPEYYTQRNNLTKAVDVWAFGLIVHEMIFGRSPYEGINPKFYKNEIMIRVIHRKYCVPRTKEIERATNNLLIRCMNKNPDNRITVDNLIVHPCFKFCREEIHSKIEYIERVIGNFSIYRKTGIESKLRTGYIPTEPTEEQDPAQRELLKIVKILAKCFHDYRDINNLMFETSESIKENKAKFSLYEKKISQGLLSRAFFRASLLLKILETEKFSDDLELLIKKIPLCPKIEISKKIWKKLVENKEYWKTRDNAFRDFYGTRDALQNSDGWKENNPEEKFVTEYKFAEHEFDEQEKELSILMGMIQMKVKTVLDQKGKNWDFEEVVRLQFIYNHEKCGESCLPLDYNIDDKILQIGFKNRDGLILELENLFTEQNEQLRTQPTHE